MTFAVSNHPKVPLDLDPFVLLPSEDSLREVEEAHKILDPPDQPLILGSIAQYLGEGYDEE